MNENYEGGMWGQNTALWAIVAIAIVITFLWFCHKSGEDKAALAGAVQSVTSRVNAIEPAVTATANNVYKINSNMSKGVQKLQDVSDDVVELDAAVFTSRCGGRSGGCNDTRYVAKNSYNLAT